MYVPSMTYEKNNGTEKNKSRTGTAKKNSDTSSIRWHLPAVAERPYVEVRKILLGLHKRYLFCLLRLSLLFFVRLIIFSFVVSWCRPHRALVHCRCRHLRRMPKGFWLVVASAERAAAERNVKAVARGRAKVGTEIEIVSCIISYWLLIISLITPLMMQYSFIVVSLCAVLC